MKRNETQIQYPYSRAWRKTQRVIGVSDSPNPIWPGWLSWINGVDGADHGDDDGDDGASSKFDTFAGSNPRSKGGATPTRIIESICRKSIKTAV